jgi:hypothetical protein
MTTGFKCPCCGEAAGHLGYRNVEAHGPGGGVVMATVMACPHCDLVLGASVSPAEYVAAMLRNIHNAPERSPGARKVEEGLAVG